MVGQHRERRVSRFTEDFKVNDISSSSIKYEALKRASNVLAVVSKILMVFSIIGTVITFLTVMFLMAVPADFFEINYTTEMNIAFENSAEMKEEDIDSINSNLTSSLGAGRDAVKVTLEDGKINIAVKAGQNLTLRDLAYAVIPSVLNTLAMVFLFYFATAFFKSIGGRGSRFCITLTGEEEGVFNKDGLKALKAVFIVYIIRVFLPTLVAMFIPMASGGLSVGGIVGIFVFWFAIKLYDYLVTKNELKNPSSDSGNPIIRP